MVWKNELFLTIFALKIVLNGVNIAKSLKNNGVTRVQNAVTR